MVRATTGYVCHMCGDEHTNQIVGNVTLHGTAYRLNARHIISKQNPKCRQLHTISAVSAEAYVRRFMRQPQLGLAEAEEVLAACVVAGMHFGSNSSKPRVWRLDEPANGFRADAMLAADDVWRLLLLRPKEGGGGAAWRRKTLYPGLHYEYLDAGAWVATIPDAAKPPFWNVGSAVDT